MILPPKNLLKTAICHTATRLRGPWQDEKPLFFGYLPYCHEPYKTIDLAVAVKKVGKR